MEGPGGRAGQSGKSGRARRKKETEVLNCLRFVVHCTSAALPTAERLARAEREAALKTITHKKPVSYRTVDYKKIDLTAEISSWRILSHDLVSLK